MKVNQSRHASGKVRNVGITHPLEDCAFNVIETLFGMSSAQDTSYRAAVQARFKFQVTFVFKNRTLLNLRKGESFVVGIPHACVRLHCSEQRDLLMIWKESDPTGSHPAKAQSQESQNLILSVFFKHLILHILRSMWSTSERTIG